MKSKIDTIQISTDIENIEDIRAINNSMKKYISKVTQRDNKVYIVLHGSKTNEKYNYGDETYTYSYFLKRLHFMIEDLGIKDYSKIQLNRVDYCFDYEENFNTMFKLNNLLSALYGLEVKAKFKDMIESNTLFEQERTNITIANEGKTKQLYIYNKELQSNGKHPYKTRQEFRYKRLRNRTITEILDSNYSMIDSLYDNFDIVEQLKVDKLFKLFKNKMDAHIIGDFKDFVKCYNDQIVTRKICEELYYKTGHTGKFNNWLKGYRKRNAITFVTKHELKKMFSAMKSSIKNYRGAYASPFFMCRF